jgi:hypothetical protein
MRQYKRDGYTLVQRENPWSDGRAYAVILPNGCEIGTVRTYMATMERRTPGRMYVNARWHAERWCARIVGSAKEHFYAWETPGRAAEWLVREAMDAAEKGAGDGSDK